MSKIMVFCVLFFSVSTVIFAEEVAVKSPDGAIEMRLTVAAALSYSVTMDGKTVLTDSKLQMEFGDGSKLGNNLEIRSKKTSLFDQTWTPVYGRKSQITNRYNEAIVQIAEKDVAQRIFSLECRVYNDGIAFRYAFDKQFGDKLVIKEELNEFSFEADYTCWPAFLNSYTTEHQALYPEKKLSGISPKDIIGLPLTIKISDQSYCSITEAALDDWAGLYLTKHDPANVLKSTLSRLDNNAVAVETQTPHVSPWRVIIIGRSPSDLVNSDIVLNLNEPSKISDTSWIKPGVSSWNWLSCGGQMDMELLKGFIDLSASMNWEYALIDDGWYKDSNCMTSIDKLDIPALVSYAAGKNVKLWLWVHWQVLDARLEETFALYQTWGIAGVKIDFMSRDDQWMVNWYHKVLQSAASHKLMIDFHGCYKPTGSCRTWPNFMTCEAIYGNEQNLGSRQNDPVHKTTLPFTRMLAGPMDYTPGSLSNETKSSWSAGRPVKTLGTRCQELAICTIYDSPFLAMADKPENYYDQKGIEFLKNLPTAWDDTKVLDGQIGQYITMIRKKNDVWYVAAITNWDSRTLTLPLSFLDSGSYSAVLFEDGPDAGTTNARDVVKREMTVTKKDTLSMKMASGGGFAAILKKTK